MRLVHITVVSFRKTIALIAASVSLQKGKANTLWSPVAPLNKAKKKYCLVVLHRPPLFLGPRLTFFIFLFFFFLILTISKAELAVFYRKTRMQVAT